MDESQKVAMRQAGTSQGQSTAFDHWRKTAGLFLGPATALVVLLASFPTLSPEAHRLAGVASFVIIFWITEAIPIPATALLGVALAVLLGIAPAGEILPAFGDPIIFLFIGSFMIARAMQLHGVDRRIAFALLAHPWVGGNTYRTLWALGLTPWALSMWISNTASVAMLFPVAVAATLGASLGFMLPVSTPPNAIVYGSRAVRILDMVKAGVIIDIVSVLLVWATATWWVPWILR